MKEDYFKLKMPTHAQVYNKFKTLAVEVKNSLKKKGLVVPIKNRDGTISLDHYTIEKQTTGFYIIKNKLGDVVVDQINLPQTAALLANGLALGKWLDLRIYNLDREYGYRSFEKDLFRRNANRSLKNKNLDRADMLFTKFKIAHSRVESSRKEIISSFEKLRNLH